jgi:tetratricopeptide (TPR) repeat protein
MKSLCIALVVLLVSLPSVSPPCLANTQSELINLNNDGVKALNEKKWQLGIDKFTEALSLDPTYELARDNLIIAHNNWGDELRKELKLGEALKQFHLAIYKRGHWSIGSPEEHIAEVIRAMGKNPNSFADRVALGSHAKSEGDLIGAAVEYDAAVQLQNDPEIHKKLADVYRQLGKTQKAATEDKEAEYAAAYRDQLKTQPK